MFNPFPRLEIKYLPVFVQKGVKCFVKQTYERGRNMLEQPPRPAYLLSHYEDVGLAKEHLDSIKHDPHARILMLNDEKDYQLVKQMAGNDSGELVYLRFIAKDANLKARKVLDKKLHAYIDHKLEWKAAGFTSVLFDIEVHFGEIYVVLKYGSLYQKVKIEEIESSKGYVL